MAGAAGGPAGPGQPRRHGITAWQACPTQAIVFGDLNVPTSRVSQLTKSKLSYEMLEELHTKTRVRYLGRVRNPGVDHSHDDHGHDHGHGHDHSHDHDHAHDHAH